MQPNVQKLPAFSLKRARSLKRHIRMMMKRVRQDVEQNATLHIQVITYSLPNLTLHNLNNIMMRRRHITGKLCLVASQRRHAAAPSTSHEPTTGAEWAGRIAMLIK